MSLLPTCQSATSKGPTEEIHPGNPLSVLIASLMILLTSCPGLFASDSICAKVNIEISQEVAFERQAFEARMTISNNLPATSLSNIEASIFFQNSEGAPVAFTTDQQNTDPGNKFFVILPSPPTSVGTGTSTKLIWQIIPTAGASGNNTAGTLYFAGATLKYTALGRTETVEVAPDFIVVKPQPLLRLDYFLPTEVFGDDLLTPDAVEPVEPYLLGLRVLNQGGGSARSLALTSGSPRIVANSQNLTVSFSIKSATLNDQSVSPLLQVQMGDLQPASSAMVAWTMETSIYGRIEGFSATYSHSDELGGNVTSLISGEVGTHELIAPVRVDLPDEDTIRDFLALTTEGNGTIKVFESDGSTTPLPGGSVLAGLVFSGSGNRQTLAASLSESNAGGYAYLKAGLPSGMPKGIRKVVRADGKVLPAGNAWVSKKRLDRGIYEYSANVFDTGAFGNVSYEVEFGIPLSGNQPPTFGPMRNLTVNPGNPIAFVVRASDPEGSTPVISLPALPAGATFVSSGGAGNFAWTPQSSDVGSYALTFAATDGTTQSQASMLITVSNSSQLDSWKERWFGSETDPNIVANWADPDSDGLANLLEYALDLDPTSSSIDKKPILGRVKVDGENYLTLTYVHRTEDPNLQLKVVGSSDVKTNESTWDEQSSLEILESQDDLPPGMKRTTFRDSVSLEDAGFRYLRLRVNIAP